MVSSLFSLLLIGLVTNAAVFKKSVVLSNIPRPLTNLPLDLPLFPSCGCNFPIIPNIVSPVEVPICNNVPTRSCPNPVIEVPTYFSSPVPVPSCGSCGSFSTAVELALSGSGIPSCSCSNPVCGCSGSVCGCSTPVCGCSTPVCGCSTPVCGCSTPVCGCSTPVCGCSTPVCGCSGPCGCSKVDVPAYYYSPSVDVCGGCNDPLCACGAYISPVTSYGYAPCGCAPNVTPCGCAPTLPPLPPVLGSTKYIRQVVIQPPFL